MKNIEITNEEVHALYKEREEINKHVNPPKPDPAIWPPEGYAIHPENPDMLYKVISAENLAAELFESPEKKAWLKEAKKRLLQIDKLLIPYFFENPKDEGMQRKTKEGFVTSLKTGINRIVDQDAIEQVLEKCKGKANNVIEWEAKLVLKQYRTLDAKILVDFDQAIIEKPTVPTFEIIAKSE